LAFPLLRETWCLQKHTGVRGEGGVVGAIWSETMVWAFGRDCIKVGGSFWVVSWLPLDEMPRWAIDRGNFGCTNWREKAKSISAIFLEGMISIGAFFLTKRTAGKTLTVWEKKSFVKEKKGGGGIPL